MKTRLYRLEFCRIVDDIRAAPETREIRAASQDQARARLLAMPDLAFSEIDIVSCKAIPKTASDEDDAAAPNPVRERIEAAEPFSDDPAAPDNDSEDDEEHAPERPPVDKLNAREWKILREAVHLDENDADNGKRLLRWFGGYVLHVQETGWHQWRGTHWDLESGQHAVERAAHKVVDRIKREAALIDLSREEAEALAACERLEEAHGEEQPPPVILLKARKQAEEIRKTLSKKRQARWNFAVRSGDRARTTAMISQAEPHKSVPPAMLDTDDLQINCLNGTLKFEQVENVESDPDSPTFQWRVFLAHHDPDDLNSKVTACNYDPDATAPHFLEDLEFFQPDPNMREFLQVLMGYTALGLTGEQIYSFFYGDGANGKSSFLQAVARTLGLYYKPMNYTSVSGNNMPTGDKPSPDWARLSGVRFLTIEEVPKKEPIKEELIKLITSGAPMPVRHLNKGMFDLVPKFTCIMTSNGEPHITGHDKGIWRRTLIVPWDVTIPEQKKLTFDAVMARYDNERDGIFAWLVEGALKYLDNGLQIYVTDRMRDFTASVKADRDAVGAFVGDCLHHAEASIVTALDLYKAFESYCRANGIDPIINSTAFGRQIKRQEVEGIAMERRKSKVQGVRRYNDLAMHDVPAAPGDHSAI